MILDDLREFRDSGKKYWNLVDTAELITDLVVEACEESVVRVAAPNSAYPDRKSYEDGWNASREITLENLKKLKSK